MQENIALTRGIIYTGRERREHHALLISEGIIQGLVPQTDIPADYAIQDAMGWHIAPGLVDLQVYGGGGTLFAADCSTESADRISRALVETGTTGYFMTLATNTLERFDAAAEVLKQYRHPALMGLHFEGPYLSKKKRGAHPEALIRKANLQELQELIRNAGGNLRMMTVAPEEMTREGIAVLLEAGITLSAGHSMASFEEGRQGFAWGIQAATHLFNAMSPFHHRDTGLPGAVFQDGRACASIIADGIHVDYQALDIAKTLLKERLFLITDAVEAAQTGIYQHVRNKDHFTLPDGTLSGSALTLLQAVENCVQYTSISLEEALRMASLYPANLIGRGDIGRIENGCKANLILFDDAFKLREVYLEGRSQLN